MSTEASLFSVRELCVFIRSFLITFVLVLPIVSVDFRRMLIALVARFRVTWMAQQQRHQANNTNNNETVAGKLIGLYIYPVKSLRAVSVPSSTLDDRGLVGDRRFMIVCPNPPPLHGGPVDATHRFITQRQCPALATITATLQKDTLRLSRGDTVVSVNVEKSSNDDDEGTRTFRARIWDTVVEVLDMGDEAATFLQSIVTTEKVRLVAMKGSDPRSADDAYVPPEARTWTGTAPKVALTDGFPILVACTASLDELNRRLVAKGKTVIPMSRFRPNIVIETTKPFEEDHWKVIQVGDSILHLVKACPRCKQSCTDQLSGVVSEEPLVTLADFRALGRSKEDVYFAQNAIPHNVGTTLTVGTSVKILKWGEPVWDKGPVPLE